MKIGNALQELASVRRIHNVFDDGGYKELLLLSLFNLAKGGDRTGNDAIDDQGREYEIKTVARVSAKGERKKYLNVTTEHTLTLENVERYRNVHLWIVAVFDQSNPEVIYEIPPARLERYFSIWEAKLRGQELNRREGGAPNHLNNPKIPLSYIANHGIVVWDARKAEQMHLPTQVKHGLLKADELLG
ncbi:hypothetical protein ACIRF8_23630 [Streptomyces sp. NPDC102406]|uniref:hypothetical protein n=1 Tax=Streptomyces sp. NPDC102406 TaxID=3366171 RepID=UPI00380B0261